MNKESTEQKIFRILKKIAPDTNPDTISDEDNFREVLDIDSFDYLNFIVGIDEEFGIDTPEQDYGKIGTLKKLVEYIGLKSQQLKSQ